MQTPEIIEFKNQRILVTEQLADIYETNSARIVQNFSYNSEKFIEGKHYFLLKGEELKNFKRLIGNSDLPINKFSSQLLLWTKQGASRHSKMLNTDKAWDMFDLLEENYFNPQIKSGGLPTDPMEILQLTFEAQKQTNERVGGLEIKFGLIENSLEEVKTEICLSRNQKFQLASKVRSNAMKAVGGKRSNAYKELYKTAIAEHWREIKNYFDVNSYEEIPKLRFEEAMELADEWTPSMELKMRIKKANTYVAI